MQKKLSKEDNKDNKVIQLLKVRKLKGSNFHLSKGSSFPFEMYSMGFFSHGPLKYLPWICDVTVGLSA